MENYLLRLFESDFQTSGEEPVGFVDDEAAIASAVISARDIVAEQVREGAPVDLADYISVCKVDGREIAQIIFRNVIVILDRERDSR